MNPAKVAPTDPAQIRRTLELLTEPDQVFEIRILKTGRTKTVRGYFKDFDAATEAAAEWSGKAPAVYLTLNPVDPALLARAENRLETFADTTTSDKNITCRRWLIIDVDPIRPSGISSTDAEHEAAIATARGIYNRLNENHWPAPITADSGNGAHLLYRIDLPNDEASKILIERVLKSLAHQFNTNIVEIDTTMFNASRISKLYGTTACKGDNTTERPHRLARLLNVPETKGVVAVEQLRALADELPEEKPPAPAGRERSVSHRQGDYFATVNDEAIKRLSEWVPVLFPTAKVYQAGYRVKSKDLHRDLEEDLSILPSGIVDFGVADQGDAQQGRRTPIDLVLEWGKVSDAAGAAHWLCQQMSIDPVSIGWREPRQPRSSTERPGKAGTTAAENGVDITSAVAIVEQAVAATAADRGDRGALFEDNVLDACRWLKYNVPAAWQRCFEKIEKCKIDLSEFKRLTRSTNGQKSAAVEEKPASWPYSVENGVLVYHREINGGTVPLPLCNFAAQIEHDKVYDDGAKTYSVFEITGTLADGQALRPCEVMSSKYNGLGWVTEHWGSSAVVNAGTSTKDHLRCAIQRVSLASGGIKKTTTYGHLGWRMIEGEWLYLHNGGALGAKGNRSDINVEVDLGNMRLYQLPDPDPVQLGKGFNAAMRFLEVAPARVGWLLLGSVFRAPMAELHRVDFSFFLPGRSGNGKSVLTALALNFFGKDFTDRNFPANWIDSESDLEVKAHHAKDTLLVIDDFKPHGGQVEVKKLHARADRILRGVGNQAARGRRWSELTARPYYHPRAFIGSSGEDIPQGQSLRARMVIAEIEKEDVDWSIVSELQQVARDGLLVNLMACFIQWLAQSFSKLKADNEIRIFVESLRSSASHFSHKRHVDSYTSLIAGIEYFLMFAMDHDLIDAARCHELSEQARLALETLIENQIEYQRDSDECARFLDLIRSGFNGGRWHICDKDTNGRPINMPQNWGWRSYGVEVDSEQEAGTDDDDKKNGSTQETIKEWNPAGERIGWSDGEIIYLDPDLAFANAQKLAREQGDTFEVTQQTLWKRLKDRRLLAFVEERKKKNGSMEKRAKVRKMIAGDVKHVLAIHYSNFGVNEDL